MSDSKKVKVDYTHIPCIDPETKKWVNEMQKEAGEMARKISKYYDACIATMIIMFCKKHKCTVDDVAIYQDVEGMRVKFWIGFKDTEREYYGLS